MTSRNTVVYRYHGIFEMVYYCRAFPSTAHPYSRLLICRVTTPAHLTFTHTCGGDELVDCDAGVPCGTATWSTGTDSVEWLCRDTPAAFDVV